MDTLRGVGLLLIATAGLSVFIALSNAMQERRYDLAVMRTLGASRRQLFTQPLLEAMILAGAGALLGIMLGHLVAEFAGRLVPEARNMGLTGLRWLPEELYVILLAVAVGLLSALLPAIQAYRTDIAYWHRARKIAILIGTTKSHRDGIMRKTPSRGLALALLLGTSLMTWSGSGSAFSQEQLQQSGLIDPSQIPSVHNTFYKVPEGAIGWDLLGDLDVSSESIAPLQTIFHTEYNAEVKTLDGREIKLMGFIFPLEGGLEHEHFLLTAWPPSCPFCLPAGPSQMVEVFCEQPVEFTDGAIMMAGNFELLHEDQSGLYYRLHDAREVERFNDIRWTGQLPQQPQVVQ